MLNVFSCASWPSVCLLGEMSISKGLQPFIFDWAVCFDDIKPHELFVNFGD